MTKLTVQITADPITGNPREAEMFELRFTRDWEIEITTDIYEKNEDGERLFDVAQTKPDLTDKQRQDAMAKHYPKRPSPYTTRGAKVNAQGEVDPAGEINEIDFLFSLTFEQFKALMGKTDQDSVLQTVKEFVGLKMQEISARGQN